MFKDGFAEARQLLLDWLTILSVQYNEEFIARTNDPVDVRLTHFAALAPVPRLVFGLLKSELMPLEPNVNRWAFVSSLIRFTSLIFASANIQTAVSIHL